MIQEINDANLRLISNEQVVCNSEDKNELQNKEVMVKLSKIQIGDILRGKLILNQNQSNLKLENGLELLVKVPNKIVSNQFLDFLVVGKSKQHLDLELSPINHQADKQQGMEEAIIKEMQLPDHQDMKQIIGQWVEKQLPLVKKQLLEVYHFAKHYDIPSESLINLREQETFFSEQELQLIHKVKVEGIQLIDYVIEDLFLEIGQSEAVELNVLFSQLNQLDLNEVEEIQKLRFENLIEPMQDVENANQVLEQRDLINFVLKTLPKEHLKEIAKKLVHKYLMVNREELLVEFDDIKKSGEFITRLKDVINNIEKCVKRDSMNDQLKHLEQIVDTLDKYQTQGQYYCFPLQVREHQTSGELYYFKPKKHKNKCNNVQGMYIVLALDMPSLKHIEIHLIEQKDQLEFKIKVGNEKILKLIQDNTFKLKKLLEDTSVPIGAINVECLQITMQKEAPRTENLLNRLDFRI